MFSYIENKFTIEKYNSVLTTVMKNKFANKNDFEIKYISRK